MKKILIFTFILISFNSFSQAGKLKKADDLYLKLSYAGASEIYESLLGSELDSPELKSKLANCFFQVGKLKESEELYATLVNGNAAKNEDLYAYAQVLKQNGKYAESDKWMKKYHSMVTSDSRGREFIENENYIQKIEKNGNKFSINNLKVNSKDADFGGYIYKNKAYFITSRYENSFVKTSWTWNDKKFLDLYRVDLGDSQQLVLPTIHTKRVNTKFHEGPISFTPDGKKVFYTRNNIATGSERKDKKGIQNLKIYIADVKQDNSWLNEREFVYNSKEYSIGHPSISSDGKTLYFVSDMPGGYGGADIYRVQILEDEKFGKPENLGKAINTEGKEMFPFINTENLLFFSSDGHVGLGGLDVFVGSPSKSMQYNKILNVGTPVNSNRDDFAFVMDSTKRMGYFSSNREGGKGDDDIYSYILTKPFTLNLRLEGVVTDVNSKEILDSTIVYLLNSRNEIVDSTLANADGKYEFSLEPEQNYLLKYFRNKFYPEETEILVLNLPEGQTEIIQDLDLIKDYGISLHCLVTDANSKLPLENATISITELPSKANFISGVTPATGDITKGIQGKIIGDELKYEITLAKEGYLTKTLTFTHKIDKEGVINVHEKLDLSIGIITVGGNLADLIDINPIYFDLGKFYIRKDAAVELDKVVAVMNKYPGMVVELGSHTDCRSSKAFNLKLSDKRAKASAAYIKARISKPERIYGKGYGEVKLINDCGCEGKIVTRNCTEEEHQANRRTEFIIKKVGATNVSVVKNEDFKIPTKTYDETKLFHIVEETDNLYIISVNNGISVDDLMKLNNMTTQKVTVGQIIKLRNSAFKDSNDKNDELENKKKDKTLIHQAITNDSVKNNELDNKKSDKTLIHQANTNDSIKNNGLDSIKNDKTLIHQAITNDSIENNGLDSIKNDKTLIHQAITNDSIENNELDDKKNDKTLIHQAITNDSIENNEIKTKSKIIESSKEIPNKKVKNGDDLTTVFNLNPIYYDLNSSYFRKESLAELNQVVKFLNDHPDAIIKVRSHTDCKESQKYNIWLSKRRADRVVIYVRSKIVKPSRVSGEGLGESELLNECSCELKDTAEHNCSDEQHQQNRRTEFIIVEIGNK